MLLFLVFLVPYTLSQFFRAFLAVISPGLARELALSAGDLANMSAAWFAVFAIAQFPLGILLDRHGPRRTVPLIMLAGVAGSALLAQAQGAVSAILALALIGLGCSPIYMGALYYYARTESPGRFGFLSAMILGLGSVGNLLAATPLALATEWVGWRTTLASIGVLMLVSALVFWWIVRDPPAAERPAGTGSALAELTQIVMLPGLWTLMPLLALGYACVVVERGLWVGPYLSEVFGLAPVPLGNAVMAMAISMSAGALVFGWLDKITGRRKLLVLLGNGFSAAGFLVLASRPDGPLALAVATTAVIGFMGLCHPLLFAHARAFFPDHLVGRGITFANFLTIGGAGLVQFATGVYVAHMQAAGIPSPAVFAAHHIACAATVAAAMLVYVLSPRK